MKPMRNLEEIMTEEMVTLRPEDPLKKAVDYFDRLSIHHLLITDGKHGKLLGILSKTDVLNVFLSNQGSEDPFSFSELLDLKVSDAMTEDPIYLDPSDSIGLAADLILSNKFHSLPIVEDNKLMGIVTSHDLLKFAFQQIKPEDITEPFEE